MKCDPMLIKGLQKTTLVDYPGKVASTIFLFGCDFRCPFCYNRSLVFEEDDSVVPEDAVMDALKKRKGLIEGVCVTGGEPCMSSDLPKLLKKIKAMGLAVKLDTNGSHPEVLRKIISQKLADYVAMDVKAPPERYSELACADADIDKINESIAAIRSSGVDYEFRTTVVPLLTEKDIIAIAAWIKGAKRYCLQQFDISKDMLNPEMKQLKPYSSEVLVKIRDKIKDNFEACELRV